MLGPIPECLVIQYFQINESHQNAWSFSISRFTSHTRMLGPSIYGVFIGKYGLYDLNMTSTGGSRPENLKIQIFHKKSGFLKKSPLHFPIVKNSNCWVKFKNRDFLQKSDFLPSLTSVPFGGPICTNKLLHRVWLLAWSTPGSSFGATQFEL